MQCHPNVRETLVCFKAAKLTLRFQPEKIQCGLLVRLAAFSSCTGGYAAFFSPHFFILEKKEKPNNTLLMGCFETCWTTVSSGHLDDTMQAAWRHATFFIRPCFLSVLKCWRTFGPDPLGEIYSLCETQECLCGLENVTTASIDTWARGVCVCVSVLANYPLSLLWISSLVG